MARTRRTTRSPERNPPRLPTKRQRERFLEQLAAGHSVTKASQLAGIIRRQAVYEIRDRDLAFAAAWEDALEQGADAVDDEIRRRAVDGIDKPVFYQGACVATIREYSDSLLMFLAKAKRPDVYRDNVKHEHAGADGGPIEIRLSFDPDAAE